MNNWSFFKLGSSGWNSRILLVSFRFWTFLKEAITQECARILFLEPFVNVCRTFDDNYNRTKDQQNMIPIIDYRDFGRGLGSSWCSNIFKSFRDMDFSRGIFAKYELPHIFFVCITSCTMVVTCPNDPILVII